MFSWNIHYNFCASLFNNERTFPTSEAVTDKQLYKHSVNVYAMSASFLLGTQWGNSASLWGAHTLQTEHWFEALRLGEKNQYILQAFVQRQIVRSECFLESNCSASFLARPCFCCLFTIWQSLSLFCYFQHATFRICIYFPLEMVFRLQRLFACCYSASFLPAPALICHAVSSPPLMLPSTVWAF